MINLVVKKLRKKGRGVFANRTFQKGEVVEVCPVIVIPKKDSPFIEKTIMDFYWYDWGSKEDSAIVLGYGSLYNHSFTPNVEWVEDVKNNQMLFKAIKKIRKGQEIMFNYNGTGRRRVGMIKSRR